MTFKRMLRIITAWIVVLTFFFPIYYWTTVAFKNAKEIFDVPPRILDFTPTLANFEKVFGISFGFGFGSQATVTPGGGNFYMAPRLWDTIVVAVGSTVGAVVIATLAAYALSRIRFRGRHQFVAWVLSTRMMPPVAVAVPMFFIYKEFRLLDTYIGVILIHTIMNLPLAVLLLKSFFDDIPHEIDESAMIDGSTRWQIFVRLILPMSRWNRCDSGPLFHLQLDRISVCFNTDSNWLENSAGCLLKFCHVHRNCMGQYGSTWGCVNYSCFHFHSIGSKTLSPGSDYGFIETIVPWPLLGSILQRLKAD